MSGSGLVPQSDGLDAHCSELYEKARAAGMKLTEALDAEIALLDAAQGKPGTDLVEWQAACRAVSVAALEYAEGVREFRLAIQAKYTIP